MGKPKGSPKTGGRAKGTPNKTTTSMRDKIQDFIDSKWDDMNDKFDKLPIADQFRYMIQMFPYVCSKVVEKPEDDSENEAKSIDEQLKMYLKSPTNKN